VTPRYWGPVSGNKLQPWNNQSRIASGHEHVALPIPVFQPFLRVAPDQRTPRCIPQGAGLVHSPPSILPAAEKGVKIGFSDLTPSRTLTPNPRTGDVSTPQLGQLLALAKAKHLYALVFFELL
jgi:hypothetical protein